MTNKQYSIYDEPQMSGYSYGSSLPAYQEKNNKELQKEIILTFIKNGYVTLLQLSEKIKLPQSTVAGRVNDLISEGKVFYNGLVEYKNRKRKHIFIKLAV